MIKIRDYDSYFNKLKITNNEADALIEFLSELAEIGINNFIEKEIEDERLCNMD